MAFSESNSFSPDFSFSKAKSNYRGYAENPAIQKFHIHFFIDNSNVNFILYTLSCPNLKTGQLNFIQTDVCIKIINEKMNIKFLVCWVFDYNRVWKMSTP